MTLPIDGADAAQTAHEWMGYHTWRRHGCSNIGSVVDADATDTQ